MYEVTSGDWNWNIDSKNHKGAAVDAINSIDFNQKVELGQIVSVKHSEEPEEHQQWFLLDYLLDEMKITPNELRIVL